MQAHEMTHDSSTSTTGAISAHPADAARWASFAASVDDIHRRAKARVGAEDLAHIRRVD